MCEVGYITSLPHNSTACNASHTGRRRVRRTSTQVIYMIPGKKPKYEGFDYIDILFLLYFMEAVDLIWGTHVLKIYNLNYIYIHIYI